MFPRRVAFRRVSRAFIKLSGGGLRPIAPTGRRCIHSEGKDAPSLQGQELTRATAIVLSQSLRALKYSWAAVLSIGLLGILGLEGLHQYAEHIAMGPAHENNEEIRRWEWHEDFDHWNGDPNATGTDPAFSFRAAHALRSAWMSQNLFRRVAETNSEAAAALSTPEHAATFVQNALLDAQELKIRNQLHPDTLVELFYLYGSFLERSGPHNWEASRQAYNHTWALLPGKGIRAAQVSLKLGDLNDRLGNKQEALEWWQRCLQISRGQQSLPVDPLAWVPSPGESSQSPALQRTLTSALVSISASLASNGQFEVAHKLEDRTLAFLRSLSRPSSLSSVSPPEALHHIFLLHRSILLSIHTAEVLYVQKKPASESISWLSSSIQSSERVFSALTGAHGSLSISGPSLAPPLSSLASSPGLNALSKQLIGDTCRTAAEAWNMSGLLSEQGQPDVAKECYTKALQWASVRHSTGELRAAPGILEAQFEQYRNNLRRLTGSIDLP